MITVSVPDLRSWRYAVALTQRELAEQAGVSESTISRIERSISRIERISRLAVLKAEANFLGQMSQTREEVRSDHVLVLADKWLKWVVED